MANPTTNFGWVMPTSTSLVTNLPADFNTFGQAVDTSMAQLKGGTTGQILSKTSATDMAFTWITNDVGDITAVTAGTGISGGGTSGAVTITNSMATEITASGDIIVGTGSGTFDNLPIGTTGQVLTADTTVSPYKVKWSTPSSSTPTAVGCSLSNSVAQTISNSTTTTLTFNTEEYDTDAFHSTSTNTGRITIPTGKGGKYFVSGVVNWAGNATGFRQMRILKNGATNVAAMVESPGNAGDFGFSVGVMLSLAAADYLEIVVYQNSTGNLNVYGNNEWNLDTTFCINYLGA